MKLEAQFISWDEIKVVLEYENESEFFSCKVFTLIQDGVAKEVPIIIEERTSGNHCSIFLRLKEKITLGHRYEIADEKYASAFLDVSCFLNDPEFDQLYTYQCHDLGITYHKEHTTFKLWSPLAESAEVLYSFNGKDYVSKMNREDYGVFSLTIEGDLDGATYQYRVKINDEERTAIDPYAIASTPNGTKSVVIDLEKTRMPFDLENLPPMNSYCDAVIYEMHVRDFTIFPDTDVEHKGKFLGAVEKGRRSKNGALVGLDHLVKLGITHVQLLPIFDYATVDELHPDELYNWGYDPMQYNVPEGSFASHVEDPYSRIIDCKKMIQGFHQNGIRVNMDVVYNHMYQYETTPFEILCPGYYFRKDHCGHLSNGSFCGNDLNTERPMVRSFIVDSCLYWMKEYGIDGFRFDLMGIIDIDTMKEIEKSCRELRKDFMIYGEGWNMPTFLPDDKKTMMGNASKLLPFAFFNDAYRDIAKGKTSQDDEMVKGYLLGQENYIEGFKFAYMGAAVDYCYPPLFSHMGQSVNYVECHDNATLYDKIMVACYNETHEQRLRRVVLINEVLLLSYGIPFIHMGQEIGLTKYRDHNSYRSGDLHNQMDYRKMEERKWMAKCMNDVIRFRKMYPFFRYDKKEDLKGLFRFENLDNGGLLIDFIDQEKIHPFVSFKVFINPSLRTIYYDLKEYYRVLFNEAGILKDELYSQSLMINGLTVVVVAK